MINLEWRGGIGYGDIIGPISYAHNLSYQLKERVHLNLHWKTSKDYIYSDNTPERLHEQAEFIHNMCEKSGTEVSLDFIFNSDYEERFNNYYLSAILDDPKHNEWLVSERFKHTPIKNKIAINSTLENIEPLREYTEYDKEWKDAQKEDWVPLIQNLKSVGYDVVEVGYRTPINECVEHIRTAEVFLGYHGSTLWLAKLIGIPCLAAAEKTYMRTAFMRTHYCGRIDPAEISEVRGWITFREKYIFMAKRRNSDPYYAFNRDDYRFQEKLLSHVQIL